MGWNYKMLEEALNIAIIFPLYDTSQYCYKVPWKDEYLLA